MTQVPPAELMLLRKLRYTIPDISSKTDKNIAEEAEQKYQRNRKIETLARPDTAYADKNNKNRC